MNEHQRDLRQAAEEAFKESLERLQQSLLCPDENGEAQAPPEVRPPIAPQKSPNGTNTAISIDELEDAVKDIEQFLSHQDIAKGKLL